MNRGLVLDLVEEWGTGELFKLVDAAPPTRREEFSEIRRQAQLHAITRKAEAHARRTASQPRDAETADFAYAMEVTAIREERDEKIMHAAQYAFR